MPSASARSATRRRPCVSSATAAPTSGSGSPARQQPAPRRPAPAPRRRSLGVGGRGEALLEPQRVVAPQVEQRARAGRAAPPPASRARRRRGRVGSAGPARRPGRSAKVDRRGVGPGDARHAVRPDDDVEAAVRAGRSTACPARRPFASTCTPPTARGRAAARARGRRTACPEVCPPRRRDDAGGTRPAVPWRGAHLPGHAVRVGPAARGQRPLGAWSDAAWRELGHDVVILAPARSAALLRDGRHRLRQLERGDATALAAAARRRRWSSRWAWRCRCARAARRAASRCPSRCGPGCGSRSPAARYDVVDCLDAHLPGPSALALRESTAPTVATWFRAGAARRQGRGRARRGHRGGRRARSRSGSATARRSPASPSTSRASRRARRRCRRSSRSSRRSATAARSRACSPRSAAPARRSRCCTTPRRRRRARSRRATPRAACT